MATARRIHRRVLVLRRPASRPSRLTPRRLPPLLLLVLGTDGTATAEAAFPPSFLIRSATRISCPFLAARWWTPRRMRRRAWPAGRGCPWRWPALDRQSG